MPNLRIVVLFGGVSEERDVSIASAAQVIALWKLIPQIGVNDDSNSCFNA